MMKRYFAAVLVAACSVVACSSFKDAMTAHVDVVAKAGTQELSVDRLSDMLGKAKIPMINADIARQIAEVWGNYQLLAEAAANNDSLKDPKAIDQAMWPMIAQLRAQKFHDQLSKTWGAPDTSNAEAKYNQGTMLAARHILLRLPENATDAQKDSVRKKAEAIRADIVKNGNFAAIAQKESQDPGSAARGGDLGLFPRGAMIKEFDEATAALKPGEISQPVLTQFGYHIIRRDTYDEVKNQFSQALAAQGGQVQESTYIAKLDATSNVQLKSGAVATVRSIAKDPDAAKSNDATLATYRGGSLSAKRLAMWISSFPPQQMAQLRNGLQQAPDSAVANFVKGMVRNEMVLKQADSAKVNLTPAELSDLHSRFTQVIGQAWQALGISPAVLKDSAKSASDRARFASLQVDKYLDALVQNPQTVQFIDIPQPVSELLREKYGWKLNPAGLERAVQRANKIRASADSSRAANRPATAVPMGPPVQLQGQPGATPDSASVSKAAKTPPAGTGTKKP